MEPIELTPDKALALICSSNEITIIEQDGNSINSYFINRNDVNVIVSNETLYFDPNPDKARFKIFYIDPTGHRVYLETKIDDGGEL